MLNVEVASEEALNGTSDGCSAVKEESAQPSRVRRTDLVLLAPTQSQEREQQEASSRKCLLDYHLLC